MSLIRRSLRGERKPRPARRRNKACPAAGGAGVARGPLLGLRQRLAEPSAHHDQLHARRDQPGRRRHEQPAVHLQQQVEPGRVGKRHSSGRAGLGPADQHQLRRRPRRRRARGLGRRRAGQSRVRRYPDRRLQLRLLDPRPHLSAAAGQQLLDRRRHDVQHGPVVQHRVDLRPVHRGHARVRPLRSG